MGKDGKSTNKDDFNQQTYTLHLYAGQNPQQEKEGALLFLRAPGELWTRYGPVDRTPYRSALNWDYFNSVFLLF